MLILNEPKVGAAGGALGTACLPGGKEPSWASPPTSSVLFLPAVEGRPLTASRRSPRISIPLAACDADFGAQDDLGAFGRRSYPIDHRLGTRKAHARPWKKTRLCSSIDIGRLLVPSQRSRDPADP